MTRTLAAVSDASQALLSSVQSPRDLKALPAEQIPELADEIRAFLIEQVSQTGGHLGPNLGVVELTLAIHRVFTRHGDPIVFDTGHQSYVHKIITGRQDRFPTLRQRGGMSGYPSREESEHDWVENSHASTALSYAAGLARGLQQQGRSGTVGRLRRRRLPHRRHGVGSAQQHRLPRRPAVGHRGQRQRALLHADGRRSGPPPGRLADESALRAVARPDPAQRRPHAGGRRGGVRPAARAEDRAQGRGGAAEHVLRPRTQVRRTDRRSRRGRRRARAAAGQAVRRPGARALPDEEGQRLQGRRRSRRGPVPCGRQDRRPDGSGPRRSRCGQVDRRVLRGTGQAWRARRARGGDQRRHDPPHGTRPLRGRLSRSLPRCRDRRAARGHHGGRAGHDRPASGGRALLHLPQPRLRPGSDGRRAAPSAE